MKPIQFHSRSMLLGAFLGAFCLFAMSLQDRAPKTQPAPLLCAQDLATLNHLSIELLPDGEGHLRPTIRIRGAATVSPLAE